MPRARKANVNRTDLMAPKVRPEPAGQPNGHPAKVSMPKVPNGLPYGERQQMEQSMRQVPVPNTAPSGMIDKQALQSGDWRTPVLTPLDAPSERPFEHVMTGAIGQPTATPTSQMAGLQGGSIGSLLQQLSTMTGSDTLADLARRATTLGQ